VARHSRGPEPQHETRLPFGEGEFDGVGICVSIDYLTRSIEVLREVGRVLRVGYPTITCGLAVWVPRREASPDQPKGSMLRSATGVTQTGNQRSRATSSTSEPPETLNQEQKFAYFPYLSGRRP